MCGPIFRLEEEGESEEHGLRKRVGIVFSSCEGRDRERERLRKKNYGVWGHVWGQMSKSTDACRISEVWLSL